jgi:hypothetical protein
MFLFKSFAYFLILSWSLALNAGDLDRNLQASNPVTIVGDNELYGVEVDSSKRMSTNARVLGTYNGVTLVPLRVDSDGNLVTTAEVISQVPNFREFRRKVLAVGATDSGTYTMAENTAIKEVHVGGLVQCEGVLGKYNAAYSDVVGAFNSSPQVAAWTNTSAGSSALLTWTYATDQFVAGTGSAKLTFTQSDNNNYPEITYTFPTVKDLSEVLKVSASVRVTVAAGGSQTRTVQIRLRSGTAIRIWQVVGTTTTAPFATEQWQTIGGDLSAPSTTAGTGTFDINNVDAISLRLVDGGNKAGSIWWDNVKFYESIDILEKIYSAAGTTTQTIFDPVLVFNSGESLYISMKNNSANTGEVQISASGVKL